MSKKENVCKLNHVTNEQLEQLKQWAADDPRDIKIVVEESEKAMRLDTNNISGDPVSLLISGEY